MLFSTLTSQSFLLTYLICSHEFSPLSAQYGAHLCLQVHVRSHLKSGCSLFVCLWGLFSVHSVYRKASRQNKEGEKLCSTSSFLYSSQMTCLPTSRRSRCVASCIWSATGWCWPAWLREAGLWSLNGSTTAQSWPASRWSTGERNGLAVIKIGIYLLTRLTKLS